MQFEAAEEHLRAALASGATLATRADAAISLGRCAIASGGRSAAATADAMSSLAGELWPADPERSLEVGAEVLLVAGTVPTLRPGLATRLLEFRDLARGRPAFEAVARIISAQEQLLHGGPAAAATDEVQAALVAGLPPSAQNTAGLAALFTLVGLEGLKPDPERGLDVTRLVQGIATGIGFLGAGTILKLSEQHVITGLTTAAGIWLTAAIGMAVGAGWLWPAMCGVVLAWAILYALHGLDHMFTRPKKGQPQTESPPSPQKHDVPNSDD